MYIKFVNSHLSRSPQTKFLTTKNPLVAFSKAIRRFMDCFPQNSQTSERQGKRKSRKKIVDTGKEDFSNGG